MNSITAGLGTVLGLQANVSGSTAFREITAGLPADQGSKILAQKMGSVMEKLCDSAYIPQWF